MGDEPEPTAERGGRGGDEPAEQAVSLLQATLDATADGILVVDREGNIVRFNRRFLEMWRIPPSIIEARDDGKAIAFVMDQLADPDAFEAKIQELYADPETESFDVLTFKDGRTFERYSLPQKVDGRCVGRVWSFRDVTERLASEEALRQSEERLRLASKLESIGRLAGGIAHDFNNLLMVIRGYSQLLLETVPPGDPLRPSAEEIVKATERASSLTQKLLAFSRRQVLRPRVVSAHRVLGEMDEMLRRLIGEDIELAVIVPEDAGCFLADPNQIEQVILNLAVNARDAMPRGGRLTLEAAAVETDEAYGRQHAGMPAGPYVRISITDTGCGMTAAVLGQVFEPFFTTKEKGKGTGLGLSSAYGVVKQSGGYIWGYSEPGVGTTFKIYLPRVAGGEPEETGPPAAAPRAEQDATVLLVEDDATVRALVYDLLRKAGYKTLLAEGAEEARRITAEHGTPIDLLLTDVVMPGASGPELALELARRIPRLRVLYMSGYPDEAVAQHGLLERGTHFLQKPFRSDELLRKIGEVLGLPPAAPEP